MRGAGCGEGQNRHVLVEEVAHALLELDGLGEAFALRRVLKALLPPPCLRQRAAAPPGAPARGAWAGNGTGRWPTPALLTVQDVLVCVAAQAPAPACAPPGQAGKRRCDAGATHTVASPHPRERQGRGPAHLKLKVLELRVGRALGNNAACRVGGVRARLLARCALLVRAFPAVVAVRHPQLTGSAPLQRLQISGILDGLGRVFDAV